jgi:TetR/AcrR family transcriptional regulator, transcriptional repressor for nem operon
MVGRPRSFDRDLALDAFVDVFWTHGYEGADVDRLQASAGIRRGSFYAAFSDKPTVFLEALRRYLERTLMPRLHMLEEKPGTRRAIADFLNAVGEFVAKQGSRGCMLSEALMQSSELDPVLRREVRRVRANLFRKLKRLSGGDDALASFALGSALGFHALARSGASRNQILAASSTAAKAIELWT